MSPISFASSQQALSHLFFHCCFKDGVITKDEIKIVSEKLVAAGLNADLNFTDEVVQYQSYRPEITDEQQYLNDLIACIRPTNELALFSYCVELCLGDSLLQAEEEALLQKLAMALRLEESEQTLLTKLMVQRKVVETEKVF
jgi:uncharacterized tellurite resistance protein B-like protein